MKYISVIKKCILLLFSLILIYTIFMITVSLIPNDLVEKNVNISLNIIDNEGTYPKFFFDSPASRLDNFTDKLMVGSNLVDEDQSVIKNSMIIKDRIQYWQGYLFFLKPLFTVFNLYQIRYIMYLCFFIFFVISILQIAKKINVTCAICYCIAVLCSNVPFVSVSLQYIGVYYIMFLNIIVLLHFKDSMISNIDIRLLWFLFIGSFTCFIDFLTVPLITLGIPLSILLILFTDENIVHHLKMLLSASIVWAFGYGFTFIGKWCVASVLLGENVFSSSLSKGLIRVNDESNVTIDRLSILKLNIKSILGYDSFSIKELAVMLIWFVLIICILHHLFRKTYSKANLLLLLIALYPYIWYMVLANHSQIHFWFTYRSQIVTIFPVLYLLLSTIDFRKMIYKS
ncbi:MAG: hypothetical protein NC347_02880 [Clostridium sp.]|nr:hypothetical protein [Clostridium sp.]